MKAYLAGPMSGKPAFNYPMFHRVAALWRAAGYEIVNPAENFGGDTSLPKPTYLRKDLGQLLECDALIVLSGWEESEGASLEAQIARALGMPVFNSNLHDHPQVGKGTLMPNMTGYCDQCGHPDFSHEERAGICKIAKGCLCLKYENDADNARQAGAPYFASPNKLTSKASTAGTFPSRPPGPEGIETFCRCSHGARSHFWAGENNNCATPKCGCRKFERERDSGAPPITTIRGGGVSTGYTPRSQEDSEAAMRAFEAEFIRPEKDEFDVELDAIRELHAAKRADYTAGQDDRLANYRFSAGMMGVPIDHAMLGRMSEKIYRLKSLYAKGGVAAVADESMDDTLRDIAIIAILMKLARQGGSYGEPK